MKAKEVMKKYGIGLTGGTASGKSTVASYLLSLGYPVIDADHLAREAVAPSSRGLAQIVEKFGGVLLRENGRLNRKRMAELIFSDSAKKRELETIIHPIIHDLLQKKLVSLGLTKNPRTWFYEATLLFETGAARNFRQVWAIHCPVNLQLMRLVKRDKKTREMAERIIRSQWTGQEKTAGADVIIDSSSGLQELHAKIRVALEHLPKD